MSAYYVIAIVIAVGAVVLSAIGLTREDFPPSSRRGPCRDRRRGVLVVAGVVALLATTHVEHPREEAAEAAAEKAEEAQAEGATQGEGGGKTVRRARRRVLHQARGREPARARQVHGSGSSTRGRSQHDLAAEGNGVEEKTPLIDPGRRPTSRPT